MALWIKKSVIGIGDDVVDGHGNVGERFSKISVRVDE